MAALQFVDVPGYNAILFRRTYQDLSLPGALMDRAAAWLANTGARWNGTDKCWTFPSGARLNFGYLEHENQKYRYQGAEFHFIGFDEATQFQESQYTYLFSRLRKTVDLGIPLRMRAASNPGGVGHAWVRQRFLVEGEAKGRPFIRSGLDDNPYIRREEYLANLMELDPLTRAQLLAGDWDAKETGLKFRREWWNGKIVQSPPPDILVSVRFWDLAATEPKPGTDPDYTAGCLMSVTRQQVFCIHDFVHMRGTPQAVERTVQLTAMRDGPGVQIYMEKEPGASGVSIIDHYRRRVLLGYPFYGYPKTANKEVMANPLSSQCEAGNVLLLEGPWIPGWFDEAEQFPLGPHDDRVDAASGAYAVCSREALRALQSASSMRG